jgi:hypothetical protein
MTTLNFGRMASEGIDRTVPRKKRIREREDQLNAFLATTKKLNYDHLW